MILAGDDELLNEITDMRLIQVHVFVNVGGIKGLERLIQEGSDKGAGEHFAENIVPMCE